MREGMKKEKSKRRNREINMIGVREKGTLVGGRKDRGGKKD